MQNHHFWNFFSSAAEEKFWRKGWIISSLKLFSLHFYKSLLETFHSIQMITEKRSPCKITKMFFQFWSLFSHTFLKVWKICQNVSVADCIFLILFFQLCVVIIAVFGVMAYRVSVTIVAYQWASSSKNEFFISNAKVIISMSAAFLNLCAIVLLNKVSLESL